MSESKIEAFWQELSAKIIDRRILLVDWKVQWLAHVKKKNSMVPLPLAYLELFQTQSGQHLSWLESVPFSY